MLVNEGIHINMSQQQLIVISGPTAVGKTALSIELAKAFNGEVINGDSMQIYRHLNIGTAKASLEERDGIQHHLLDIRDVNENYSVAEFKRDAKAAVTDIIERGHVPILVGGTGLYLEAFLYDLSLGGKMAEHPDFRVQMQEFANEYGNQALHDKLYAIDSKAAENIHFNNVRRVIRALEVNAFSDHKFSDQEETGKNHTSPYDLFVIGLDTDRALLYERINERVKIMIKDGLLEEAKWLQDQHLASDAQSIKAIGYKELFPYLNEQQNLEEVTATLQQNSRRYAKRQLTWVRNRMSNVHMYNLVQNPEQLILLKQDIVSFLNK